MEPNQPKRKAKTVMLALDTTERLDKLGARGDTYNDIIDRLLNSYDWEHEAKHDIALGDAGDVQQQINQLWESVTELRKDFNELEVFFNTVSRLTEPVNIEKIKKAGDKRD